MVKHKNNVLLILVMLLIVLNIFSFIVIPLKIQSEKQKLIATGMVPYSATGIGTVSFIVPGEIPHVVHGSSSRKRNETTPEIPVLEVISECTESWICTKWSECTGEGKQYRACKDLNGCGTYTFKPKEEKACRPSGISKKPFSVEVNWPLIISVKPGTMFTFVKEFATIAIKKSYDPFFKVMGYWQDVYFYTSKIYYESGKVPWLRVLLILTLTLFTVSIGTVYWFFIRLGIKQRRK